MFDFDQWREILSSIQRHKLRTALTALGVFWGIFMLVILLGAGSGLQNGVEYQFRDDATNSIFIRRGTTALSYNGLPKGRNIRFYDEDYNYLANQVNSIEYLTARYYLTGDQTVTYGNKKLSFPVRAVHPDHKYLENTIITQGRYINKIDLQELRKVAVLGKVAKESIFGTEDAIGKEINIGGIIYKVVGTYEDTGGENEMRIIYLPITTVQKIYGATRELHQLMFTVQNAGIAEMKEIENQIRRDFANRHQFDPKDLRALYIINLAEEYKRFQDLFFTIRSFVWFVGVGTLLAGVIGVSNIMLIVVKDRTKEIGIRKALGATPHSIVAMILQEAIFITSIAGYLGLLAGLGVIALLGSMEVAYFRHPQVHLGVAATSIVVLVIAGALAGLMPALQAARINPIIAMKGD